jgi:flavin-dependent dehydrogenase
MSDFVIIGAGPTGCALGSYLAKAGASVTLVEAIEHPEGVVGESMLPCSTEVFEELGFDTSGFNVKHGAVFCQDGQQVRFDFTEAEDPRWTSTWQVQREVFDIRWRGLAQSYGCKILYAQATDISLPGVLSTTAGPLHAERIIDAAGRGMWLSTKLGLRVGDPRLKNAAIGTRCTGVVHAAPDQEGDITICCIPGGWIWIIPFGGGVASVGVVMSPACPLKGTAEERFTAAIAASPDAQLRLRNAKRIFPFRGLQDFTASSTVFSGDGFALCGDAATFIDPVFSSGVLLGLVAAKKLSQALTGEQSLEAWEAEYREGAAVFRRVIDCWYNGNFMTVALAPKEIQKKYFRTGIVSLLAGDVFNPAKKAPRRMSLRMPELAAAVRNYQSGGSASLDTAL